MQDESDFLLKMRSEIFFSDLASERQLFVRKKQFYRNISFDGIYSRNIEIISRYRHNYVPNEDLKYSSR